MNISTHLDLIPQEKLIRFLRCKKTEISSCMNEPQIFFQTLRDHELIPDDHYQKVIKRKSRKQESVYEILDWLENERGQCVKQFWSCVFQDHILQKYPFLRQLQTSLLDECSWLDEMQSSVKKLTENEEKQAKQKKGGTKRKKSVDETEEEEGAGRSSVSSSSHEKLIFQSQSSVETDQSSKSLKDYKEEAEDKDPKEELESKSVDLQFKPDVLPVSCGSVSGDLYKSRFADGSRSKSIRTEDCWFTPEEFVMQELTLMCGDWKKYILCHGKTLDYLVKNKVLCVHSLLCGCQLCCPDNPLHQDKDDVCFICSAEGLLVCCTECPRAFHHHCHFLKQQDERLRNKWMCSFCELKFKQELRSPMSREDALNSPVLENMQCCEYLLLRLYMEDTQRALTDHSTATEERYTSVICKPMWLDKVKIKLHGNEYKTVGEFVRDIRLIFSICQTFNRDNKSGRMGTIMEKNFEKEFDTVFKIQ